MRDTCVVLLSDFGSRDVYAGVMKGVISRIAPRARLIDLTHEVPAGDVRLAAFRLWQAFRSMPPGAVFLAVVDPGVGTARRPLAVRCEGFSCVGPDNGIFTYMLEGRLDANAFEISRLEDLVGPGSRPQSNTFHGRDVFAPAAALLARGMDITRLGPAARKLVRISLPRPSSDRPQGAVCREALHADGFGNMVTSIGALVRSDEVVRLDPWVPGCAPLILPASRARVRLGKGGELPLEHTFGSVPPGRPFAYIGSDNLLEIGVNRGKASDLLELAPGTEIDLFWQ